MHPAVEWHAVFERLVYGRESVYRGHDGVNELWRSYRTDVADFQIEAEELRDLGDDRVLLLGWFRWRGPASGIESESKIGMIITVRGGKLIQSTDYPSHQEALKAVGLEE
jgi:ketosteroid isomerase-like protein